MAIKRMNYFTGEFLNETDFREEQQYHIDMLRRHNENLHTWGIIKGLEVTNSGNTVHISGGMAIDSDGQQIILLDNTTDKPIPDTTDTTLYLTISYDDKPSEPREDAGIKGDTRITEEPLIEFLRSYPVDDSKQLILAKLTLKQPEKTLTGIILDNRKSANAMIALRSIDTSLLADNAVTSTKLQSHATDDGQRAVTANHIKNNAIIPDKLQSHATDDGQRAVTTNHIRNNAVTPDKLQSHTTDNGQRAVTTNHIRNNAVTPDKLQSHATDDGQRAVTTNHIKDFAVTAAKLDAITQSDITFIKDFAANIGVITDQRDAINSILKGNLPSDNEIKLVDFQGYYGGNYVFSYKDNSGSTWLFFSVLENGGGSNLWCKRYTAGSWGADMQLTTGKTNKGFVRIVEDSSANIWMFWNTQESEGGKYWNNLWCKRYSAGSWGADTQLTTGTTSKNYLNSFDDRAGNFWVFWAAYESTGGTSLYCRKYTYNNYSWGAETPLVISGSAGSTVSKYYSNSFSDNAGNIWLFWYSQETGSGYNIWSKKYSAGAWGADAQLTSGTTYKYPFNSFVDKAGNIWLFWTDGGNLWCKKYSAGSWGADTQITTGTTGKSYYKIFEDSAGNIWLFWYDSGNLWGKKYSAGSWGTDTQLTTGTTGKGYLNSFEDISGNIWLFWYDGGNLWGKKYSAGSWGTDMQITTGTTGKGYLNSFGSKDGSIWLFYNTYVGNGNSIWVKRYNTGSWGADTQITTGTANNGYLNSFEDNATNTWLFWYSYQGGGYDIRCNRYNAGSWGTETMLMDNTTNFNYLNSFETSTGIIWFFWYDGSNLWCKKYSAGVLGDNTQITTGPAYKSHLNSFGDRADNTWVFWSIQESGGGKYWNNFWAKKYSAGNWGADMQLTNDTLSKNFSKIFGDNAGNIWFFWTTNETAGGSNIYCKKYSGGSWGIDTPLTSGTTYKYYSNSFGDDQGNIWLFWSAYETAGGNNIWCKKYSAGSWGADTQLTTGTTNNNHVNSFEDTGGNIWLIWFKYETNAYNFWAKKYSAGTWVADIQFTTGTTSKSYINSFEDTAGNIWLFWYSYESGSNSIWSKKYKAGSPAVDTQITTGGMSYINSFEDKAGNIWFFWYSYESGGYSIWCKKYSAGMWDAAMQPTPKGTNFIKSFEDHEGNKWLLFGMPDNIWGKRYSGDDWLPEIRLTSGMTSKNYLNSFVDDKGDLWLAWSRYLPTSASFWCKKLYSSV